MAEFRPGALRGWLGVAPRGVAAFVAVSFAGTPPGSASEFPAGFESATQGHLIGILKVTAHRQAARDARHADVAEWLDQAREVGRRRLPLYVGVGGQHDLGDVGFRAQTRKQLAHAQLIGTDAVGGRYRPVQHVIVATELARALDGADVAWLLDDRQQMGVSVRVGADGAELAGRKVKATRTEVHRLFDLDERVGQALGVDRITVKQMVGDALRAFGADPRQALKLIEQLLYGQRLVHRAPLLLRA